VARALLTRQARALGRRRRGAALARADAVVARLVDEHDDDQRERGRGRQGCGRLQDPPRARREAVGPLEVGAPAGRAVLVASAGLLAAVRAGALRHLGDAGEDVAHVLARAGANGLPGILLRHPT
jgi:hypothetical protein